MRAALKKYWRHTALAMQETLAYRVTYIVNMFSMVVTYTVIFFVWSAVYAGNPDLDGYQWQEMKSYLIVSLFLSSLVSMSSEFRISRQIRTGNIAVELLRPADYQKASLSITLGYSISEGVLIAIACLGFAFITGATVIPQNALTWLLFIVSVLFSMATKFLMVYVFGLVSFWTTSLMGISWLRRGLTDFFSGALIPLALFPSTLRTITDWLPFKAIVWIPASVFTGRLYGRALTRDFAVAFIWIVVLWFLGRLVWKAAMRKVTIQGG